MVVLVLGSGGGPGDDGDIAWSASTCANVRKAAPFVVSYKTLLALGLAAHPPPNGADRGGAGASNSHPPAICSNGSGWDSEQVLAFLDDLTI